MHSQSVPWRVICLAQLEPYADKDIQNALKQCLKKAKRMAKLLRTAVSPTAKTDKSAVGVCVLWVVHARNLRLR